MYVCVHVHAVCMGVTCPGERMRVRGQLCGVHSLFPSLCGLQGDKLGSRVVRPAWNRIKVVGSTCDCVTQWKSLSARQA